MTLIEKGLKKTKINPLKNLNRYWESCVIYIWGDYGTGKSKLCTDLFPGMYEKDDVKQWEEYNNETIDYNRDTAILMDDFYGYLSWTNLLKLTDRKHCRIDVKYDKANIIAMYICLTGNGPVEELYKKLRLNNSLIKIGAFERRLRYIIKFEGKPIQNGSGNVVRIFEKGNKKDFNNRIFDIEFNEGTSFEE